MYNKKLCEYNSVEGLSENDTEHKSHKKYI